MKVEFRLFEVTKGDTPVLSKDYRGPRVGGAASRTSGRPRWCKYYTGESQLLRLAHRVLVDTGKLRRDVFAMDWDGAGV